MKYAIVATLLFLAIPIQAAQAMDQKDIRAIIRGTVFYDPDEDQETCTTPELAGNNNPQKAFNYFVGKGLSAEQSAGIVGNLQQESYADIRPDLVSSNGATGIAQWMGGRAESLYKFAEVNGREPLVLDLQLDFIWFELTGHPPTAGVGGASQNRSYELIKQETTVRGAAISWMENYERPGNVSPDPRIQYAEAAFKKYANYVAPSGENCSGGGIGVAPDGFTFPLITTQEKIKQGGWCYDSQISCHGAYPAADIIAGRGTVVVASVGGTVSGMLSNTVCSSDVVRAPHALISGDDGLYYYYTHMEPGSVNISVGQRVEAGDVLGKIGPAECGEGTVHLHFHIQTVSNLSITRAECRDSGCDDKIKLMKDPQPWLTEAFKALPTT